MVPNILLTRVAVSVEFHAELEKARVPAANEYAAIIVPTNCRLERFISDKPCS
jgi:hypothetical protein